ncbi:hypothetical protein E2C01_064616 [Portunus trituberculatus]|uniref:Uncharacterized protein n=1 Tax=Portunus trituberculatus TaxID=210409 RepID=A0A5B7HDH7_PORTR|nr:hypothetical protein [Portunus trituberculatus]
MLRSELNYAFLASGGGAGAAMERISITELLQRLRLKVNYTHIYFQVAREGKLHDSGKSGRDCETSRLRGRGLLLSTHAATQQEGSVHSY